MEVDQFEHINATLGHYSGDRVLKAMVVVLMRKLRATDFLARYEAGKFALLLPETSVADAAHVAHELRRLRRAIFITIRGTRARHPIVWSGRLSS
jgi:diguanylate cyclase